MRVSQIKIVDYSSERAKEKEYLYKRHTVKRELQRKQHEKVIIM